MSRSRPPIPQGRVRRAAIVGARAGKYLGARALRRLQPFPGLDGGAARFETEAARELARGLIYLRGTALKLAQTLGLEPDLVPPEVQAELDKSYYRAPPLNRALARKVVFEELGDEPERLFERWDGQAFAAASLGQVHAARLVGFGDVAVKVQYPGIDRTIEDDLVWISLVFRRTLGRDTADRILSEVSPRLREELDYRIEADRTEEFAEQLRIEGVTVPRVARARSSRRVLTTERMPGVPLDAWLATAPPVAEIDLAGQRLFDAYMRSLFELGRIHADPNPGNVLYRPGGALALIDFGCVRTITPGFGRALADLFGAVVREEPLRAREALGAIGVSEQRLAERGRRTYEDKVWPFLQFVCRPCVTESFAFREHPEYAREGRAFAPTIFNELIGLGFSAEVVFPFRFLFGMYRTFGRTGARIRMRDKFVR